MNVNLNHEDSRYNLSLQKLTGSLNAENIENFFKINQPNFEQVVGLTTDGAAVMKVP